MSDETQQLADNPVTECKCPDCRIARGEEVPEIPDTPLQEMLARMGACVSARVWAGGMTYAQAWDALWQERLTQIRLMRDFRYGEIKVDAISWISWWLSRRGVEDFPCMCADCYPSQTAPPKPVVEGLE